VTQATDSRNSYPQNILDWKNLKAEIIILQVKKSSNKLVHEIIFQLMVMDFHSSQIHRILKSIIVSWVWW
jgi:hypothetical protein